MVNIHDFPQASIGKAIPYGIYDIPHNKGTVYVGHTFDTPRFAVDAISRWWREEGMKQYPSAKQLLILADAGGSNSYRSRLWKHQLQTELSDRHGLAVTVCHYPSGCSKWNPVEHRLFSFISMNWAGKPLQTFEKILSYIRGTMTQTGLTVKAWMIERIYEIGERVSDEAMKLLNMTRDKVCPDWNYTFHPRAIPLIDNEEYSW